jgi:hypothetical protein
MFRNGGKRELPQPHLLPIPRTGDHPPRDDAGIIIGDHWQVLHTAGIECAVDRVNPRIEIVLDRVCQSPNTNP